MFTDMSGLIECRSRARLWSEGDKDAIWTTATEFVVLSTGNANDAIVCHFEVRNSFGFKPLAEDRPDGYRRWLAISSR